MHGALAWASLHPWLTFFIALAGLGTLSSIFSSKTVVVPGVNHSGVNVYTRLPSGNGVYHGLVRR